MQIIVGGVESRLVIGLERNNFLIAAWQIAGEVFLQNTAVFFSNSAT